MERNKVIVGKGCRGFLMGRVGRVERELRHLDSNLEVSEEASAIKAQALGRLP